MNRKKVITISILVLSAIVAVLLYNKAQMQARSRSDVLTQIPVSVTKVGKETVANGLSLVGTIVANNDVSIISETQGRVTNIYAEVGQYKNKRAALVQVDDELKKAAFITAESNREKAKRDLERFEELYKQEAATDQQMEGARLAAKAAEAQFITTQREYHDTRITTPISGIVTSRLVDVGTYVQKGLPIGNVVDISKLKVKLNVSERDVFKLKAGDRVEITTDVYPGKIFEGRIATISSKADEGHSYPVEITLPNNKEHPLRAGMFGRVSFVSLGSQPAVTIPRIALVGSMRKAQVYVIDGQIARLRDIIVGGETGNELAVLKGLQEGEIIVLSGQNNLRDSVAVSIIN